MAISKDLVIKLNAKDNLSNALKAPIAKLQQLKNSAAGVSRVVKTQLVGAFKEFSIAAAGLGAIVGKLIHSYGIQQQAEIRLAQALRNAGIEVEKNIQAYKNLAASLQSITTYGDETIMSMQAMLTQFGATAENIEGLSKLTLDLATAMNMDLKNAAVLVGKVIAGEVSALTRYGIVIDKSLSKSEQVAEAIRQLNERFGGQATAMANTLLGTLTQIKNAIGDRLEDLGQAILEAFDIDYKEIAKKLLGFFSSGEFKNVLKALVISLRDIGKSIYEIFSSVFSVFSTLFQMIAENKAVFMVIIGGIVAMNSQFIKTISIIGGIVAAGRLLGEAFSKIIELLTYGFSKLISWWAELADLIGMDWLSEKLQDVSNAFENFSNKQSRITDQIAKENQEMIQKIVNGFSTGKRALEDFGNAFDLLKVKMANYKVSVAGTTKMSDEEINKIIDSLGTIKEEAGENLKKTSEKFKTLKDVVGETTESIKEVAKENFSDIRDTIENTSEASISSLKMIEQPLASQVDTIKNSYIPAVEDLTNSYQKLKSVASNIKPQGKLEFEGEVTGLGGTTGGMLEVSGKVYATLKEALEAVKGNPNLKIETERVDGKVLYAVLPKLNLPKFAKGGITTSPVIAGEAGAEAIVPLPDGRSIPVNLNITGTSRLPTMVSNRQNIVVNNNFVINAVDAASFTSLVRRNPEAIISVIANDLRKNGISRRTMMGVL